MADDISKEELKKEVAAFLKGQDLKKMTAKKVRQGIEEKLDCDLTSRKKELDDIVMDYMKNVEKSAKNGSKNDDNDDEDEDEDDEDKDDDDGNGKEKDDDDEEEEDEEDEESDEKKSSKKRAPKKAAAKRKASSEDSDEESDAHEKNSDEEYSPNKKAKSGGGARGRKPKAKKKKAAGSEASDSDEDWKGAAKKGAKKAGKKGGGGGGRQSAFTKSCKLSPELAAVVGADSMARPEVVKKVWAIIKEKNLYDPKNKQYAICNDELMKVIGTKRFRTFGMMKYLKKHFV